LLENDWWAKKKLDNLGNLMVLFDYLTSTWT